MADANLYSFHPTVLQASIEATLNEAGSNGFRLHSIWKNGDGSYDVLFEWSGHIGDPSAPPVFGQEPVGI